MKRRVVITGMGAVTPVGTGIDAFWNAIKAGQNGIAPITLFDTTGYKATLAAEVKDFAPEAYMSKKEARRMDRFCQFAMAASQLCFEDAGLDPLTLSEEDRARFGIYYGSGIGGFDTMEKNACDLMSGGVRKVSPFMIPMVIINGAPGLISMRYQLKGPALSVVTACASSTDAIGLGFRLIKDGYTDRMLVGGSEAVITSLGVTGFTNMTALSTSADPDRASIPFDAERNGFIMGEGGAMLLIESLECAQARGARIYAEVLGYGSTADAHHITAPDPEARGAIAAMRSALTEASIAPERVGYINAHGTSTPPNDKMETAAIKGVFCDHAYRVPVSSTKSMTGHMLGAAGAIEAIVCALAIRDQFAPPTINLKTPDPDCDLDYLPQIGKQTPIEVAISNSFGFGGQNACLAIGRYEE